MDLQLPDWPNTHTFPCEAEFSDIHHATDARTKSIKRFLASGTTTVSWFATYMWILKNIDVESFDL